MKKEYITYGLIGIIAGLALGFLAGNWLSSPPGAAGDAGRANETQSVNTGGASQPQLPADHPPIGSEVVPAGPLPEGAAAGGSSAGSQPVPPHGTSPGGTPAATNLGGGELPSLDPLPGSSKEERVEQKYKNIQVLRGLPADRLERIMDAFKSSLGVDCTYCHIKDHPEKDDKPAKQMARKMIGITRDTNAKLSAARVTCFTCHRGQPRPVE
jgi:hypothetical protein